MEKKVSVGKIISIICIILILMIIVFLGTKYYIQAQEIANESAENYELELGEDEDGMGN